MVNYFISRLQKAAQPTEIHQNFSARMPKRTECWPTVISDVSNSDEVLTNRYSCDKVWKKLLSGIMGLVNTINFCDYEASSETFLNRPVYGLYKQFLLETCLWKEDELLYRIEKQLLCSWLCIFNVLRSDFTCIIYFNVAKGKRVIIYCI